MPFKFNMNALLALLLSIQAYSVLTDECSSDACELSHTCCSTSLPGVVGCCPVLNAVCCSDKLHCCPENTVCNLEKGTCYNKTHVLISLPFHKQKTSSLNQKILKASSVKEAQKVEIIYCPGGRYYCQDGNTCCREPSGQYTCCPYPAASCCNDGFHCCQHGYICDPTSRYCLRRDNGTFWNIAPKRQETSSLNQKILKASSVKEAQKVKRVYCPGGGYCQDGNTCCRTPSGQDTCCPYPAASCCKDGWHCCQHGEICDPTSRYCLRGNNGTFWNVSPKRSRVQ